MTLTETLTIIALAFGPIASVYIGLRLESKRRVREQRLIVLRMLLATRHLPGDPNFSTAINLVPVEFAKCPQILNAYNAFIEASRVKLDGKSDAEIPLNTSTKVVRLIYEISRQLGFDIRETDLLTMAYFSSGSSERDAILIDSQKAMRDVASQLILQSRIIAGSPLSPEERKYLGLPDA